MLGFLASNFVYLTESNLDELFPTDCHNAPYDGSYKTKVKAVDYFSPTKFTAPYNLGACDDCMGLGYDIKNWLISTITFSYTNGRRVIKGILSLMQELRKTFSGKPGADAKGGETLPFLASFFLVPLFLYGAQFGGFFLTMLGEFYNGKDLFSRFLWGLFFMFFFALGPMIAAGVSVVQLIQTAVTFGLLPFFQNKSKLLGIIGRSKMLIIALFGFLVLMDAGKTLQKLPQWPMWVVYFILVLMPTLFGKVRQRFAGSPT